MLCKHSHQLEGRLHQGWLQGSGPAWASLKMTMMKMKKMWCALKIKCEYAAKNSCCHGYKLWHEYFMN